MSASSLLAPPSRFLRTAHLERDFGAPQALDGYVATPHVLNVAARIGAGLSGGSRAWRLTGDYGTGKSSFGLALARVLSTDGDDLAALRRAVGADAPRLLPVLLTGSREGIGPALVGALGAARARLGGSMAALDLFGSDADVLGLLDEVVAQASAHADWDGVLLVIDELGKFLEHAALHPDRVDVHLLQTLAEAADRSGDAPLVVVGMLHQGFGAYAQALTRSAQQEWEKVAGRYAEILFDQPLEQVAGLAARALGTDPAAVPEAAAEAARAAMASAVALGWYGPGASADALAEVAPALYPLHPTALPVLARATRLYGQNERSLFSFLLSSEPAGLREAAESARLGDFVGLPAIYDYVATAYGYRVAAQSTRSHWSAISSVVDTFPGNADDLGVLKAVGLLNLLNTDRLLATPQALHAAFVGTDVDVPATLASLTRQGVLFDRGARGGVCLWPSSSVDLEAAFRSAREALGPVTSVASRLAATLEPAPIVARRHYIETGTLRHVEVRPTTPERLAAAAAEPSASDAVVLVALCDTAQQRAEALRAAADVADPAVVVLVPRPLAGLRDAIEEEAAWRWVTTHTPGLGTDAYAAEEVSRQVEAAATGLARRLDDVLGVTTGRGVGADWVHLGQAVEVAGSRAALAFLSDVCERVYPDAPHVANELINRAAPSSAAVSARLRLIDGVLTRAHQPMLGLPDKGFPPEKAMYLSVLRAGRLHRQVGGAWGVHLPTEADDPAHLRPALLHLRDVLQAGDLAQIPVPDLFAALAAPPFGVRDGLVHLLLAVFVRIYEREVALYEDGVFSRRVTPEQFQRLAKAPATFALQFCAVEGVRADVFGTLLEVVGADGPTGGDLDVLGVVTPLCVFAAELPEYALQTRTVPPVARAVREALLDAREPATLLFSDLPAACDVAPDDSARFVAVLREALDALRAATPELRARVGARIAQAFGLGNTMDGSARTALGARAASVLGAVQDRDLKAFAGRLADGALSLDRWTDSVAALVAAKPLARWTDDDEARFAAELSRRTAHLLRTEAAVFATLGGGDGAPSGIAAVRFGVTEADGTETMRVLAVRDGEAARLGELEDQAEARFRGQSRLELLAAVRALGRVLSDPAHDAAEADDA